VALIVLMTWPFAGVVGVLSGSVSRLAAWACRRRSESSSACDFREGVVVGSGVAWAAVVAGLSVREHAPAIKAHASVVFIIKESSRPVPDSKLLPPRIEKS